MSEHSKEPHILHALCIAYIVVGEAVEVPGGVELIEVTVGDFQVELALRVGVGRGVGDGAARVVEVDLGAAQLRQSRRPHPVLVGTRRQARIGLEHPV